MFQIPLAWWLAQVLGLGPRGVFIAVPAAETWWHMRDGEGWQGSEILGPFEKARIERFEHDVAKKVKHKIRVQTKTQSGWVKGYHYGAGGIIHNSVLTW